MSNGGYKGASPARETSPEQYPGVWELTEQFQAQADGNWPYQEDDCAPKSLRFNASDTSYLSRTPTAEGNRTTWTWSVWVKRCEEGGNDNIFKVAGSGNKATQFTIMIHNGDYISIDYGGDFFLRTNRLCRDFSAFMHLVVTVSTSEAIADNRVRLYINGIEETSFASRVNPNLGEALGVNREAVHTISSGDSSGLDGYLSEVHFIDGQALSCEEFGFFDGQGIWQPKRFTGDYSNGHVVYSNGVSAYVNPLGSDPVTRLFDGDTSSNFQSSSSNGSGIKFVPRTAITGSIELYLRNGDTANSTFSYSLDGGSTFTNLTTTGGNGSYVSIGNQTISTTNGIIVKHVTTAGTNAVNWRAIRVDGTVLLDPSVGRNSFHLDFSDGAKDQSGLGNDFTVNSLAAFESDFTGAALSRIYASADSEWTISNNGASASKSGNQGYYDVITNAMEPGKCYAFSTTWSTGDTNGGWWFGDINDTSLSGTHPNEGRGLNSGGSSIGQRGRSSGNSDEGKVGAHGTFATANGVASGNANLTGFTNINPNQQGNVYWVVDRISNKVWASHDNSSWVGGGNPTDAGSTPSFYLPETSNIYFGLVRYNSGGSTSISSLTFTPEGRADDIFVDSPVNGNEASTGAGGERRGNYCTLNPLDRQSTNGTLSNGNLDITQSSAAWAMYRSTMFVSSGKWYWECTLGNNQYSTVGICTDGWNMSFATNAWANQSTAMYGYYPYNGNKYNGSSGVSYATADTSASGSVIGVALDMDNGTLTFYKDGTSLGTAYTGLTGKNVSPTHWLYNQSNADSYNFGQRPFSHNAPSGHSPLATSFLPEPTIKRGDEAMDVVTYDGYTSPQKVTGLKFASDLIWIKSRGHNAWHILQDTVRGFGKTLFSNDSSQEVGNANDLISDVTDTGFSVNTNYNGGSDTATTSTPNVQEYVAWVWDAGEATTSIAAGGLNSSAYNQSQTWSGNISTTGNSGTFHSSYPATNAFNNDDANYAHGNGDGSQTAVVTLTLSPGVSCSNTVTFLGGMTSSGTATISVNGGTAVNLTSGSSATTKTNVSFSGTVTSIVITKTSSDASGMLIYGFEIDGTRLVDNGVSVTNVPTIATTVKARPDAGFSIASFVGDRSAGSTVAHQLGKAPEIVMVKNRDTGGNWMVYTKPSGAGGYIAMNEYWSYQGATTVFNNTEPDHNVIYLGADSESNGQNNNMIAYSFCSVPGYSQVGAYIGTGTDQGAFIYTGFKPALIWTKAYSSNSHTNSQWNIFDTARDPYNETKEVLSASNYDSTLQNAHTGIDILSNGFKLKADTNGQSNYSGWSYVYYAVAEHPFASQARAR